MKRLLIPVLCLALHAAAQEPSPSFDSLRSRFLAQITADAGGANPQEFVSILELLPTDGDSLEQNQLDNLLRLLTDVRASSNSKPLNALCDQISTEFNAQLIDANRRFDSELHDALEKGFAATSAQDFDDPLATVAKLERSKVSATGNRRDMLTHIARMFSLFQDELLRATAPPLRIYRDRDGTPFVQRMQSLKNPPSSIADIMPAEEYKKKVAAAIQRFAPPQDNILPKEEFERRSFAIVQGIKKPEDVDSAFVQLDDLERAQRRFGNSFEPTYEMNLFKDLRQDFHTLRSGAAAFLYLNNPANISNPDSNLAHFQNVITRRALPRILQPPAGLVQKDDETAAAFLQRVLANARERSDWPLMDRALNTALSLHLSTVAEGRDREAFLRFMAAMNEEQAHALPQAVTDYSIALRLKSSLLPADTLTASLQKIEKESPTDYAAGQKLVEQLLALYEKVILTYYPPFSKANPMSIRTPLVMADEKANP